VVLLLDKLAPSTIMLDPEAVGGLRREPSVVQVGGWVGGWGVRQGSGGALEAWRREGAWCGGGWQAASRWGAGGSCSSAGPWRRAGVVLETI
jgi:hypothetical protein